MFRTFSKTAIVASLVSCLAASAVAADKTWTFGVSNCRPGTVTVTFELPPNAPIPFSIPIPNAMTASQKAQWIAGHLGIAWHPVAVGSSFSLTADSRIKVSFSPGNTAETDSISCVRPQSGTIAFSGHFAPMNFQNQPAVFTAGIVTDIGVLSEQVSAAELNFQTDGPIICQALFQRLAPRAPQYGAQINYAGDRLEVYFDPAYTVTQGGIIFGTTSPSQGCTGTVIPMPEQPQPCPGDVNGDGIVDLSDLARVLAAFGMTANDPGFDPSCDFDHDGDVDIDDLAYELAHFGQPCP